MFKRYNKHIDNGGIEMCIEGLPEGFQIRMLTQYFGYPAIESSLSLNALNDKDVKEAFRNIGLMFIAASEEINDV